MTTFLSTVELKELTGFCQKAKQAAWLRAGKWPFEVSGDGRILVLRAYYLDRLNGRQEAANQPTLFATRSHNFAALAKH